MTKYKIGDRVRIIVERTNSGKKIKKGSIGTVIGFGLIDEPCVEFDEHINGHDGNGLCKGKGGHCWYVDESHLIIANGKIVITTNGTETLARLYEGNKVVKRATAKCSPDDTYNFETGAKLAFERLIENKPAEEVKPPKFEVGERYKHEGIELVGEGVIEITKKLAENEECCCYEYEVVSGMKGNPFTSFNDHSAFARRLTHIEKPKYYNGKVVCVKSENDDFTVGKVYEVVNGKMKDNYNLKRPAGYKLEKLSDYRENCSYYDFIPFVE